MRVKVNVSVMVKVIVIVIVIVRVKVIVKVKSPRRFLSFSLKKNFKMKFVPSSSGFLCFFLYL